MDLRSAFSHLFGARPVEPATTRKHTFELHSSWQGNCDWYVHLDQTTGKSLRIYLGGPDKDDSLAIYAGSVTRWDPPDDLTPISTEEHDRVVSDVERGYSLLGCLCGISNSLFDYSAIESGWRIVDFKSRRSVGVQVIRTLATNQSQREKLHELVSDLEAENEQAIDIRVAMSRLQGPSADIVEVQTIANWDRPFHKLAITYDERERIVSHLTHLYSELGERVQFK